MVNDLIGVPFVNGGRSTSLGLDCWGLVMEVFRRYDQTLPDFTVDAFACKVIDSLAGEEVGTRKWEQVHEPLEDHVPVVVLMRIHPAYISHAGVYLGGGNIIHTTEPTGVVISQRNSLGNRIEGYYKPCSR